MTTLPLSTCPDCGIQHGPVYGPFSGRYMPEAVCGTCYHVRLDSARQWSGKVDAAHQRQREALKAMGDDGGEIPALLRDTEIARLPHALRTLITEVHDLLAEGKPFPSLGIIGDSGKGKSRAMATILAMAAKAGHRVSWLDCASLPDIAAEASRPGEGAESASRLLSASLKTGILALDDLAKNRGTPTALEWLFRAVNHRTSHGLPLLWTANGGSAYIIAKLGEDEGKAICRRLGDFSRIVTV